MKIISFGAIFLNNAQVNKKAPDNTYQKANASFVEMNPKDSKDMKALENIQNIGNTKCMPQIFII